MEQTVFDSRFATQGIRLLLSGALLLERAGPKREGLGLLPRELRVTQDIHKITAEENTKYPFLVEMNSDEKPYKFRFENLTEFRDFLYIFLHVKNRITDVPLFLPNEYVCSG